MRHPAVEHRAGVPGVAARFGTAHARALAAISVGMALFGALFLPEARAAVEVWNASTAYGHCYLVLPMCLWLLWERRDTIAALPPRPEPIWALAAVPVGMVWFAAERLGVMEGRQLAALAGLELLFLAVLGWRLFRAISGPLLFLVFLVPFGAFLTPALQRFTADFSIVGLNLLGIPNYSDGFVIETAAGTFIVAEACAGLRFLVATVAFGVFYALMTYRSLGRRLAFVALSIVVPIIANGFRALGIVVLGQVLGSAEAAAADHIIYGWVFFSVVILLMVAAGLPLRESAVPPALPLAHLAEKPGPSPAWAAGLVLLILAAGPLTSAALSRAIRPDSLASVPTLQLPQGCALGGGPGRISGQVTRWGVVCDGQEFGIALTAFPVRASFAALQTARRNAAGELGAESVSITRLGTEGVGRGWSLIETSEPNRSTASAVWINGELSAGGLAARVAQARNSVFGGRYVPVLMTVSAEEPAGASLEQQRKLAASLRAFIAAQEGLDEQIRALSRRD